MMEYYIEVTLLPTAEIPLNQLWSRAYAEIHSGLSRLDTQCVGVGFPEVVRSGRIGQSVRLFANQKAPLKELNLAEKLVGFEGFIAVSDILDVPKEVNRFASFKRPRNKLSPARLRRMAKRQGVTLEAIKEKLGISEGSGGYRKKGVDAPNTPYIKVRSSSTGQGFSLLIACEITDTAQTSQDGVFSSYGLSSTMSLPVF